MDADRPAGPRPTDTPGAETPDALAALLRWEAAGGTWAIRSGDAPLVVDLITCDGGEVMARVVSSAPDFVGYVRAAERASG